MIRKQSEMTMETRENMRGGKGSIEINHIFRQEELSGKSRFCAKVIINPGCSIGMHEHSNEEEIYYIIRGQGIVNDNGNIQEVREGDAILTGGGASHSIENTGTVPLELMAVILLY